MGYKKAYKYANNLKKNILLKIEKHGKSKGFEGNYRIYFRKKF